ncbi:hypothetical protein [Mangrovibacterium marinum]|uniref:Porin n=1 Tax=Mangrovibacterium marinum TaxID=1639118 RepID=A0A2T5C2T8_9BACT|nr:hypothetical protein [Mangrovibacterium marinum]PTN09002.1 hypothetical protein C8N47_106100 [Mangrovibacterium marinum]
MNRKVILTLAMLGVALIGMSQTPEEFKPSGKPFVTIFSNVHSTIADGETATAFELSRLYLGYEYAFSPNFSAKANLDIGDPGVGKLQMTAYVKNAYVAYKNNGLTVNFGLIGTTAFKTQEKAWGNRYVEKSFQDKFGYNSSADLGVSAAYKFCDAFSADIILVNGEGYKKLQADSAMRMGFGATINPVKKLTARAYYDFISKDVTQSTLAFFAGYKADNFSIGAEYNKQYNNGYVDGQDLDGYSAYAAFKASKKVKLFARYDKSNNDYKSSNNGELYIAGLEYAPVKGIKIAPNFSGWKPADDSKPFASTLFVNCEIKF